MFSYPLLVREHHLDLFGHMNNATYLALFEEARWESLSQRGMSLKDFQRLKQGPVILSVELKFMKEVRLREQVTITLELLDYEGKIGHMEQLMLKEDKTVAAKAQFTFGYFDLTTRRLIEPTAEWQKALGLTQTKG